MSTSCKKHVPFDSEKWKAASGEWIMTEKRFLMTQDLLNRQLLLDKTQVEIDSMLGSSFSLQNGEESKHYYKVQDVYSWDDIDPELIYLEISFNENKKSSSVELKK